MHCLGEDGIFTIFRHSLDNSSSEIVDDHRVLSSNDPDVAGREIEVFLGWELI